MNIITENNEKSTITKINDNFFIPNKIFYNAKNSLAANVMIIEYDDGSIQKIIGKKRGNATYNFCECAKMRVVNKKCIELFKANKTTNESNTIFCTLTTEYQQNNIDSSIDALNKVLKRIPLFFKAIKRHCGNIAYTYVLECHKHGGCHIHTIIQFLDNKYQFFKDSEGNNRNDFLRSEIKSCWKIGNIDCKGVMNNNGVFNYISKELAKSGNTENALYRYEHNKELVKNDSNKIWLIGLLEEYNQQSINNTGKSKRVRTHAYSKNIKITPEEIAAEKVEMIKEYKENQAQEIAAEKVNIENSLEKEVADILGEGSSEKDLIENALINNRNKSTKKVVRFVMCSKSFARNKLKEFYKSGKVENEEEKERCKKILDDYSQQSFNNEIKMSFSDIYIKMGA